MGTGLGRYELVDGKTAKFWDVSVEGARMKVSWGKIGTPGRFQVKSFVSKEKAAEEAQKLIRSKVKKGYAKGGAKSKVAKKSATKKAATKKSSTKKVAKKSATTTKTFADEVVAFTGKLEKLKKDSIEPFIRAQGGKVVPRVNASCTMLICGLGSPRLSSQEKQAKKLNAQGGAIETLDEDQLRKRMRPDSDSVAAMLKKPDGIDMLLSLRSSVGWKGSVKLEGLKIRALSGVRLSGIELVDSDLRGADLRQTTMAGLTRVDLSKAKLQSADLRDLEECDLSGANLQHGSFRARKSSFDGAKGDAVKLWDPVGCTFGQANLNWPSIYNAKQCDFTGAKMPGVDISDATDCDFTGARIDDPNAMSNIKRCDFTRAVLSIQRNENDFESCNFRNAKLDEMGTGSYTPKPTFTKCDMRGASFKGAKLIGAKFVGCNLEGVDFGSAQLIDVSFARCKLGGARFQKARVVGCEFKGSKTSAAKGLEIVQLPTGDALIAIGQAGDTSEWVSFKASVKSGKRMVDIRISGAGNKPPPSSRRRVAPGWNVTIGQQRLRAKTLGRGIALASALLPKSKLDEGSMTFEATGAALRKKAFVQAFCDAWAAASE